MDLILSDLFPLAALVGVIHSQTVTVREAGIADGYVHRLGRLLLAGPGDIQKDDVLGLGNGLRTLGALGDGEVAGYVLAVAVFRFHLGEDAGGDVSGGVAAASQQLRAEQLPQQEAQRADDHDEKHDQNGDLPCGVG